MAAIKALDACIEQLNHIILDKEHAVKLALSCILAKGHLLIEDIPGMGKTTLAHALAACLDLNFQRIQFTSDLLPGDLLGVNIYDKNTASFEFHKGPIFTQLALADEINRASPKTQSALLEAMEERQVSIEGKTRELPEPFFVIATQNPSEQAGTYPLPESQLDRFMLRISLGYPSEAAEKKLLQGADRRDLIQQLKAQLHDDTLLKIQTLVSKVKASESIIDYVHRLVSYSRTQADTSHGLSPRAAMALLQAAKAWAMIEGRNHLLPDDIQTLFPYVCEHRLAGNQVQPSHPISSEILAAVDIF